ncbi:hypothetical protein F0Q45_11895 [Mycobacterium simiae]|uniref:Uncharacterized protein n=1 Tax=Mycobacterium simiae TaxID=1784 RepID=A0A5B1BRZ9_MYCSI|nr:hypothetical protein [Mycobacterium simiae]KAA1250024.1 hypothetical protein F0Q45_11895 [Mycobacterium simiae]
MEVGERQYDLQRRPSLTAITDAIVARTSAPTEIRARQSTHAANGSPARDWTRFPGDPAVGSRVARFFT